MRTLPEIVLATRQGRTTKARLPKAWRVHNVTLNTLMKSRRLAPITIVDAKTPEELSDFPELTRTLAERLEGSQPNFVVLCFDCHPSMDVGTKVKLLKRFAHPERVEISENVKSVAGLVENLLVKLYALNEHHSDERIRPPRPSPLDQIKSIVSASSDLRVENGNLSAQAIASVFGLSLNALAKILGRTRQALTKTPDADSLQNELGFFERIARFRTVLADDAEFRKWLRMTQAELDGETPFRWIERKRWQALADMVDDMLTGAPS